MVLKKYPVGNINIGKVVDETMEELSKNYINEKLLSEYRLLIEEVCVKLVENASLNSEVYVRIKNVKGGLTLKLSCPGKAISLDSKSELDFGGRIIEEYKDYVKQSYSNGKNYIRFEVIGVKPPKVAVGIFVASALLSLILSKVLTEDQIVYFSNYVINPICVFFTNYMQAIAIPVAFFSLSKLMISLEHTLDVDYSLGKLVRNYIFTSLLAFVIGAVFSILLFKFGYQMDLSSFVSLEHDFWGDNFLDFVYQISIENIIEPFLIYNPIPMLLIAILVGIAASKTFGSDGERARNGISAINALFSKIINLAYCTIPFFLFVALMNLWLKVGVHLILRMIVVGCFIMIPMIVVLCIYLVQLKLAKVNLKEFFRDYKDVLLENFKISSNINAFPYNKRTLQRKLPENKRFVEKGLKLGVLMNMDGNCVIISTVLTFCVLGANLNLSFVDFLSIAIIITLISIGAPNEPASFLLCCAVLFKYVGHSSDLYVPMIVIEAMFGRVYSTINSFGDITTIVAEANIMNLKNKKENNK